VDGHDVQALATRPPDDQPVAAGVLAWMHVFAADESFNDTAQRSTIQHSAVSYVGGACAGDHDTAA
jgi:hypothetical protein